MWLCTKLGFFSIVHKSPSTFHIRARCREDLDALAAAAGTGTPVPSFPGSDYPWRILCPAADLPTYLAALTHTIDYPNFQIRHRRLPHPAPQTPRLPRHPQQDGKMAARRKSEMSAGIRVPRRLETQ